MKKQDPIQISHSAIHMQGKKIKQNQDHTGKKQQWYISCIKRKKREKKMNMHTNIPLEKTTKLRRRREQKTKREKTKILVNEMADSRSKTTFSSSSFCFSTSFFMAHGRFVLGRRQGWAVTKKSVRWDFCHLFRRDLKIQSIHLHSYISCLQDGIFLFCGVDIAVLLGDERWREGMSDRVKEKGRFV